MAMLMRVWIVILMTIGGYVGGAIFALLFAIASLVLRSHDPIPLGSAAVVGAGILGSLCALCGALSGGQIMLEERGKAPTPGADAVAWIVALIIMLVGFSIVLAR
jgi:hypothetical protein